MVFICVVRPMCSDPLPQPDRSGLGGALAHRLAIGQSRAGAASADRQSWRRGETFPPAADAHWRWGPLGRKVALPTACARRHVRNARMARPVASPTQVSMNRRHLRLLTAVFAVSRIAYFAAGVRFGVVFDMHLLPRDLLEHDLLRSLWYLHSQPPAFNAFVGLGLHVPINPGLLFGAAFVAIGYGLAVSLFALMLELGVPSRVALIAASLFIASPSVVLYENWMFNTYPVALLLCFSALCFARFLRTGRTAWAFWFATSIALVGMMWSTYHIVFVLAAIAFMILSSERGVRRRALVAVTLPVLLVAGVYIKNQVLFDEPTMSTWLGMNLAHMLFPGAPGELRADVAAGHISRQALIVPFKPLSVYRVPLPHTGVPALDRPTDANGATNWNNKAWIAISRQYRHDALVFVRRHPAFYLRVVGRGYVRTFISASDYFALKANRSHIKGVVRFEGLALGQLSSFVVGARPQHLDNVAWLIVLQYVAVAAAGAAVVIRAVRRRGQRRETSDAVLVLIAATTIYSVGTSNLLEVGDNMRFRFGTDPMVCAMSVALGCLAWSWWQARSSGVRTSPSSPVDVDR